MKKDPRKYKVTVFYPRLFWRECDKCGCQYKKEKMYRITNKYMWKELCEDCVEKLGGIDTYINSLDEYGIMAPPTPVSVSPPLKLEKPNPFGTCKDKRF